MLKLSFSEILHFLKTTKSQIDHFPALNMTVLRNITIEAMEPYLRYLSYQMNFNGLVRFGEYDNILQDALSGGENILAEQTDIVMIFAKLDTLSWNLARNFTALDSKQIGSEVDRIRSFVDNVFNGVRNHTSATILWQSFEVPVYPVFGILDSQTSNGQSATIRGLNDYIRDRCRVYKNSYLVDLNLCLSRIGAANFYDARYWHIGRSPYSRLGMREIALENFKYIRPLKGKNKKCLIMDCDNTLWGGIIGEDGMAGIKLGKTYPGSAYYEFQQEILNLYHRGVVLAICSKNNEEDVLEVFRDHPYMLLNEEHVAVFQVNWNDKATNLKRIAEILNLGLDSFVFIDDSEHEIELVRQLLPQVEAWLLPQNRAVEYGSMLSARGYFDTLTISDEDKARGSMYKAEAERIKTSARFTDIETYLKSLDIEISLSFVDEFSLPRVEQLIQKTNQFNLTARRYSESDINAMTSDDLTDIIYIKVKDRFGDYGIVGTCILKYEGEKAYIDTFLLSCRVLGRRIEDVLISYVLKIAKNRGCKQAVGEYIETPKNTQVKQYYDRQGFRCVQTDKKSKRYCLDLSNSLQGLPECIKKVHLNFGNEIDFI